MLVMPLSKLPNYFNVVIVLNLKDLELMKMLQKVIKEVTQQVKDIVDCLSR